MNSDSFQAELDKAINPTLQADLDFCVEYDENGIPYVLFSYLNCAYQLIYENDGWFIGWVEDYKQPRVNWEFSDKSYSTEKLQGILVILLDSLSRKVLTKYGSVKQPDKARTETKDKDVGKSDNMIKNAAIFKSIQNEILRDYPEWSKEQVLLVSLGIFREHLKDIFNDEKLEYSEVDREFFKAVSFDQGLAVGQVKLLEEEKKIGPWYRGLPKFFLVWFLIGLSPPIAVATGWKYTKWHTPWKWILTILCAFVVFAEPQRFQLANPSGNSTLHRIERNLSK